MTELLIVTSDQAAFSEFTRQLSSQKENSLYWANLGEHAAQMVGEKLFDLVIIDEVLDDMSGLDFAKKLVTLNPMINFSIVSGLPEKEFHEVSEGLGVLSQLPPGPNGLVAKQLLERLEMITKQLMV